MLEFTQKLIGLDRRWKVLLQALSDAFLILLCFLFAMTLRLESFGFLSNYLIWFPLAASIITAEITFYRSGLYRSLVRFISDRVLLSISKGALLYSFSLFSINWLITAGIPRSVPFISLIFVCVAITGLRLFGRWLFRMPTRNAKKPVIIYGAGEAGHALLNSLQNGREYAPVAFVDDERSQHGLTISGLPVYSPESLKDLARTVDIEIVLLAMPNLSQQRRREIFASLEAVQLEVKTVPAMSDIVSGKATISELRNITAADLLGRDPVTPDRQLMRKNIVDKVVLVTGAGGSIGSELCLQIVRQRPKTLVLYEISELALYTIEAAVVEVIKTLGLQTTIVPILGSVQDYERLQRVVTDFSVQSIYHTAAYKHVPLVEENVIEGMRNNVFGTLAIAEVARAHRVESFTLISTDKAVRPTNVMGASKRIAELICQSFAKSGASCLFSMVRFGNVLGSSGSVIPRFRAQIAKGGPITVTHREINRYFMTIPEASQLVIQAGAMAKGGDVFVLHMGEPVKIVDLAYSMVRLHGLKPYIMEEGEEPDQQKGDIPICFTGLRKGEKLFEELLIGEQSSPTKHPRIQTATEVFVEETRLRLMIDKLRMACDRNDIQNVREILKEMPIGYSPEINENLHASCETSVSFAAGPEDRSLMRAKAK